MQCETTQPLESLEKLIARQIQQFWATGRLLRCIRDQALYKELGFGSFTKYCLERLGMSRAQAYRLMDADKAMHALEGLQVPLPSNERQIRPLTGLEPALQRLVWSKAAETAGGSEITHRHVHTAISAMKGSPQEQRSQAARPIAPAVPADRVVTHGRQQTATGTGGEEEHGLKDKQEHKHTVTLPKQHIGFSMVSRQQSKAPAERGNEASYWRERAIRLEAKLQSAEQTIRALHARCVGIMKMYTDLACQANGRLKRVVIAPSNTPAASYPEAL